MLSFKDKAYDYFDSAIDLLKGRKGVKEIGMLSSFYGGKMSYLMTDSLYEDASVMALEREKQIKNWKLYLMFRKDWLICNMVICTLNGHIIAIWKEIWAG